MASSNSNRIYLWLLGALVVAGLVWYAYWFASNFEEATREVRTNISPEARKNPYLAAELFLRQSGLDARSHAARDIFALNPGENDTVLLGSHSRYFLERNQGKLEDWIRAGGTLILVPDRNPFDDEKPLPLLKELGVKLAFTEEDTKADGNNTPGQCKPENGEASGNNDTAATDDPKQDEGNQDRDKRYRTVTFRSEHPGEFEARFLRDRYLKAKGPEPDVVVGEHGKPNLLMYSLGTGTVTLLSDADLFQNDMLGKKDHAYLLSLLAESPGTIWIFYSADMPSLLSLLWKHMPYLLLTLIVLLLLAGWGMLFKSGPRLQPRGEVRRNLLEHLGATAEYSWRVDKARQLFEDNRNAIEQAWRRRHPQLNTLDQAERCEWIAEKTGLTARAVERTLYDQIGAEQDFIRASSVMQKLATQVHMRLAGTNR